MTSAVMMANRAVRKPSMSARHWVFLGVSLLIGVAGAVFYDLSRIDLSFGVEALIVVLALCWLIAIVAIEYCMSRRRFLLRMPSALCWSVGALTIVIVSWKGVSEALPDPGRAYFSLRRSYIESHWAEDARTGIIYFPVTYINLDRDGKSKIPGSFFLFDKNRRVLTLSERLILPSCPLANYEAHEIEDRVYMIRQFVRSPDQPIEPCLITPTRED
jgi:hypothetical protein